MAWTMSPLEQVLSRTLLLLSDMARSLSHKMRRKVKPAGDQLESWIAEGKGLKNHTRRSTHQNGKLFDDHSYWTEKVGIK